MTETNAPIAKLTKMPMTIADDDSTVIVETQSVLSGSIGRFNSYTFNALIEVVERLEEGVLDQQNVIKYLRSKHAEDMGKMMSSVNKLTERLNELVLSKSGNAVVKTKQLEVTRSNTNIPKFRAGDVHPKGWVHEYNQGCRVRSKKSNQSGVVKLETSKSVWVLFDGEETNRLKRKTNLTVIK